MRKSLTATSLTHSLHSLGCWGGGSAGRGDWPRTWREGGALAPACWGHLAGVAGGGGQVHGGHRHPRHCPVNPRPRPRALGDEGVEAPADVLVGGGPVGNHKRLILIATFPSSGPSTSALVPSLPPKLCRVLPSRWVLPGPTFQLAALHSFCLYPPSG